MRYLRLFSMALVTMCALGAVIAATAVALPTILPTTLTSWTGKSVGEIRLARQGGLGSAGCKSARGEGTIEANGHLGLYHITFEKCTAGGGECTGLGDSTGTILSLGSWHLVYYTLGATLAEAGVATLFLVDNVHFTCNTIIGEVLQQVFLGGMVLCAAAGEVGALTKTFETQCKEGGGSGHPSLSKYYNEAGTLVSISPLESSENEGTKAEVAQVGNSTTSVSEPALLMV
jgi:hypothetical protein